LCQDGNNHYKIEFTKAAEGDFDNLSGQVRLRVDRKIQSLRANPRPNGAEKLTGSKSEYRIRVGDYRILYSIDDPRKTVTVIRIRHRREVYRNR
jgi:mRNA interferase RelE/StbE